MANNLFPSSSSSSSFVNEQQDLASLAIQKFDVENSRRNGGRKKRRRRREAEEAEQ
jgi:hypothetical protein